MQTIDPMSISDEPEHTATPTPAQLSQVRLMANLGIRLVVMAILFDVSLCHLSRACGPQIAAGTEDSHKAVLATLKEMALSKRHPSATLFWVKTFCAHLLPTPPKSKPDERDPNESFTIEVYNNDGEPNYDY
jgi:hypothetical protein